MSEAGAGAVVGGGVGAGSEAGVGAGGTLEAAWWWWWCVEIRGPAGW